MKSIKGIDLRHLSYFIAVAELQSFSRAARQLNISQPPLSAQIKDLEHRIGAKLFLRDRRGVALTEAGRALLPEARDVVARAEGAVQHARLVAQGRAGRLRLGMISTGPYNPHISGILQEFARRMPGVALDIVQMSSLDQRRALAEGELDLAFHWPWRDKKSPDFETRLFSPQELHLGVPVRHPRAKDKAANPKDFAAETWLVPGAKYNPSWHHMTLEVMHRAGFSPFRLVEKNPAPLLLSLVAAGQGVALMPDFMADHAEGVRFIPLTRALRAHALITLCLSMRRMHKEGIIADFFRLQPPSS